MCGPKFCAYNISAKVEEFTPEDAQAVLDGKPAKNELVNLAGD